MKRKRLILTTVLLACLAAVMVPNWSEIWDELTLHHIEFVDSQGFKHTGHMRLWGSPEDLKFVGKSWIHYPNGALSGEGTTRDGEYHGLWRLWNSQGTLIREAVWEEGELRITRNWNGRGDLFATIRWVGGREHSGVSGSDSLDDEGRFQIRVVHGVLVEERVSPPWFTEAEIEAAVEECNDTCPDPSHEWSQ